METRQWTHELLFARNYLHSEIPKGTKCKFDKQPLIGGWSNPGESVLIIEYENGIIEHCYHNFSNENFVTL